MASGNRGQRGPNHLSSGSRGTRQASTSRGDHSSGKSNSFGPSVLSAPRALRDTTNHFKYSSSDYKGNKYDPNYKRQRSRDSVQSAAAGAIDIFEKDRLENAAKRTKRETNNTVNGRGRGNATGSFGNKPVRLDDQKFNRSSKSPSPEKTNTFAQKPAMATHPLNPFARKQDASTGFESPFQAPTRSPSPAVSVFGGQPQVTSMTTKFGAPSSPSVFGAPSQPGNLNTGGVFGAPSGPAVLPSPFGGATLAPSTTSTSVNPFGTFSQSASTNTTAHNPSSSLGANSQPHFSSLLSQKPFTQPATTNPSAGNVFGIKPQAGTNSSPTPFNSTPQLSAPSTFNISSTSGSNFFTKPSTSSNAVNGTLPSMTSSTAFGVSSARQAPDNMAARAARFGTNTPAAPSTVGGQIKNGNKGSKKFPAPQIPKTAFLPQLTKAASPPDNSDRSSESLAKKVNEVLRKERITAPKWPGWDLSDQRPVGQHDRVKKHWRDYQEYQGKVRKALIRANLIDDPDVPKKLSDAIDFKGTCEEMCPEYERVDRILSGRVDDAEKEISPDGTVSRYPSPEKMVKALARSAAGQEAPLPDEVRSAAALRRTVDYLFGTVLANSDLPAVYTFLWDRTRAIRRDFVFHSFMSKSELHDQVDCLEKIVRFHVTAAHQMSRDGIDTQGFSEQQELEQLGKSLLSLIHAYEDCSAQGIVCNNETEFKAYYILWGARSNPGILEEVQNWGWDLWEHEETQLAVSLVEALQTPWDTLPLKPRAETDISQNAFSRFFSTIEDKSVSYTMACFAETFFNHVRFSILRTIVKSYRRQKQQSTDWTIPKINEFLRFDNEEQVIPFCESYGLNFDATAEGIEHLSFNLVGEVTQPSPPLKQGYSHNIVERKRGQHSLTEAIHRSLYAESSGELDLVQDIGMGEEEDSLFVKDDSALQSRILSAQSQQDGTKEATNGYGWNSSVPPVAENVAKPASIFDNIPGPTKLSDAFTSPTVAATSSLAPIQSNSPIPQQQTTSKETSMFTKQPEKFVLPTSIQSTPNQLPKESLASKPASTFSFLQPPAPSQALGVNETESTAALIPTELIKAPTFFPQPPVADSFLPQVLVNEKYSSSGSKASSTMTQSSPFTGFMTPAPIASPTQTSKQLAIVDLPAATLLESSKDEPPMTLKISHTPNSRSSKLTAVSKWVALGIDGLIEQFIESQVELILHDTAKMFMEEEAARVAQEADERDAIEAASFRHHSLSTKYARIWRENARLLWLKRRGRVARQARRDLAESMRASKAAKSASLVEDFRASTTNRHRESLASLLDDTGVLGGVYDGNNAIDTVTQHYEPSPKRQRSERSTSSVTSTTRKHRRGQSEQQNPLRRSLMSDPTYLHGGSRIHLISDYDSKKESSSQVSGVTTDYFRLKARGIATLPDGSPLARSVTSHPVRRKPSLDGFMKPETPRQPKMAADAQSVPVKRSRGFASSHEDIQVLKAKAKNAMAEDQMSRQKRSYMDDEEELFERAKRVREQMDEGASWYRKEIERETASRSVS